MSRDEHYSPFAPAPGPRIPTQGELLYELLHGHTRVRCELRDHGPAYGVEAQFPDPIDLRMSRTFRATDDPTGTRAPRELAIAWAIDELKAIEQGRA